MADVCMGPRKLDQAGGRGWAQVGAAGRSLLVCAGLLDFGNAAISLEWDSVGSPRHGV